MVVAADHRCSLQPQRLGQRARGQRQWSTAQAAQRALCLRVRQAVQLLLAHLLLSRRCPARWQWNAQVASKLVRCCVLRRLLRTAHLRYNKEHRYLQHAAEAAQGQAQSRTVHQL
jgi:hypothetical protein